MLHADVDVELDVVDRNNKPPVWDQNVYGPIHIKENVTVGTVVTSVKARFVCHDMTETRHVTCRAVPCSATPIFHFFRSFCLTFDSLILPAFSSFRSIHIFHHLFTTLRSLAFLYTSFDRYRIVSPNVSFHFRTVCPSFVYHIIVL